VAPSGDWVAFTPPAIGGPGLTISGDLGVLFSALCAAQANYAPLKRTKSNPFFNSKYADLADVLDACLPALLAQGFALLQPPVRAVGADTWCMYTILGHKSGGYFQLEATVPAGDWQKFGSAVTYCRRYQVGALVGVAAEPDDDANAATPDKVADRPRQNTRPTPPAPPTKPEPPAPPAPPVAAKPDPAPEPAELADNGEDDHKPMGEEMTTRVRALVRAKAFDGRPLGPPYTDQFFRSVLGPDVGVREAKTFGHAKKIIAALEALPDVSQ